MRPNLVEEASIVNVYYLFHNLLGSVHIYLTMMRMMVMMMIMIYRHDAKGSKMITHLCIYKCNQNAHINSPLQKHYEH